MGDNLIMEVQRAGDGRTLATINGKLYTLLAGYDDRRADGWPNRRTHCRTHGRTHCRTHCRPNRWSNRWPNRWPRWCGRRCLPCALSSAV